MGNFIKEREFFKSFNSKDDFCILQIGYHDFAWHKPLFTYRMESFYTWHFVMSGEGTIDIYDKQFNIKEGDMFFIPPNVKMRYYPNPDNPWEYVWLSFKGNKTTEYANTAGFVDGNPVLKNTNFRKIENLIYKQIDSLKNCKSGYYGLLALFFEIMEICTIDIHNGGIEGVKLFIDEGFTIPNLSIAKLCEDAGISHPHLLRLFKKKYNTTIIKYLISKRLEFACELLQNSNLTVSEIAFSSGFSDDIHFMKTFKKELGITPQNYRKSMVENKSES